MQAPPWSPATSWPKPSLTSSPNSGWLDANGAENGDKCAWISSGQGASADVSINGTSYPVQSLWSNAFNGGAGGCVLSD